MKSRAMGAGGTGDSYEFTESQNNLILKLADKMRFVGYFSIAGGLLGVMIGVIMLMKGGFNVFSQGITALVVGYWTINSSRSFRQIVHTRGNDVNNLMTALQELQKLYTLQYWLLIVGLGLMIVFWLYTVTTSIGVLMQGINQTVNQ